MTLKSFMKAILLIIAATSICLGQETFKQGDSWEYEYRKNAYSYYGPTPYDQSTDTMIGKITVCLDSVARTPDSARWYLLIRDSICVWQKKGAPGGYRFLTTTFILDSTYRRIITTRKDPDTARQWDYSMLLAPTDISSGY